MTATAYVAVQKAERRVVARAEDKEYLPVEGHAGFRELTARFALGDESSAIREDRLACVQTLSGTGALRCAADFLKVVAGVDTVWVPIPTYGNHPRIFRTAGLSIRQYSYIDGHGTGLDYAGMLESLREAPRGDAVLLHACAHNPTGVDLSAEQWRELSMLFRERGLVPIFDSAYQGFASGDPVADAISMRMFVDAGIERVIICQSYAKSMGLYGERVGALLVLCGDTAEQRAVLSQLKQTIVRPMWSSPPLHGARVAAELLGDADLMKAWCRDLRTMAGRMKRMRGLLASELRRIEAPGDWGHIERQIGMFAFTGLTADHVAALKDRYHIYLTTDGRMSIAGLKPGDISYVAAAIKEVLMES